MSDPATTELPLALAAVRHAAEVCRNVQRTITEEALQKKDRSPVTVADFASQAIICKALQEAFPNDPVIGEEGSAELRTDAGAAFLQRIRDELAIVGLDASGEQICDWIDRGDSSEYCPRFWTLDPIDGTKGFLRGEQYAISLALIIDGKIALGILGCPNMPFPAADDHSATGMLGWAVRGGGSFQQALDKPDSRPSEVSVTSTANTSDARFCESVESGHSSHGRSAVIAESLQITREPIRMDSQAKYASVARGDADIYMRLPTRAGYEEKIWDHAGGVIFVEEAGGKVTDIHGHPPDFSQGSTLARNQGIIATNEQIHDAVVAAVKASAK